MTDELLVVAKAPDILSAPADEYAVKPELIEGLRSLSELGKRLLRQNATADFGVAVLAEQLQVLRNIAAGLDLQYETNVRGRKIKFQDRVGYLTVREKIAARIAGLVQIVRQMQPADPTPAESGGSASWNPDADQRVEFPQAQ